MRPGPFLGVNGLTMSYFHTGTRTIIGAEAFHGPVRDGKGWDHLAMVIRLDGLLPRRGGRCSQFTEPNQLSWDFVPDLDCAKPGTTP